MAEMFIRPVTADVIIGSIIFIAVVSVLFIAYVFHKVTKQDSSKEEQNDT